MMRIILFFGAFVAGFVTSPAAANPIVNPDRAAVARSKEWLRLMHYQPRGGGFRSELDGADFFFAPDGRTNPLAELDASIAAMAENREVGRLKLHPQCSFPERFRFLREALNLEIPAVPCPRYEEFLTSFFKGPKGVSLVFSSAYPNNPASMFGHTFLKIESRRKNNLLDSGINFAAFTRPDENLFVFVYQGITGGYRGTWSVDPYFKKVNDYVNSESRDIWEFELDMSEAETQRLIAHIWELEINSHFDYFFFDENCSYQILRAVEAIRPDWTFSDYGLYVIPGETVKRVMETPGAVRSHSFRPSLFHQLEMRHNSLTKNQQRRYLRLVDGQAVSGSELTVEELEAALLAFQYRRARKKKEWSAKDQEDENRVLALRARHTGEPGPAAETPGLRDTRPDLGHDPSSVYLSTGSLETASRRGQGFGRIKIRSAFHDQLASDIGYSPFTEIEFPWLELQWHADRLRIQEFGLASSTSLFPLTAFDRRMSWRLRWALETERGAECNGCLVPRFETAAGGAFGGELYRVYFLGVGRAEAHRRIPDGYRLRPGLELGVIASPLKSYKTRFISRAFWSLPESEARNLEFEWNHSFRVGRNQEIRQSSILNVSDEQFSDPSWTEFRVEWVQYFR